MSAAWAAYRMLAPPLGALAPVARVFVAQAERAHWSERMGRVAVPGGCDAWVHAASLGEARAAAALVRALLAATPGARLMLTAQTVTGRARLAELGPPVALAPIDSPQATARFFAGVAPRRVLIVETELWPHWLLRARDARVPVALVSARLSQASVRRYRMLGDGLRALVAGLAGVLCQTTDDAGRWRAIGAPAARTEVAGNLKSDALPARAPNVREARAAAGLDPGRPLLVLGSLRPGEGALLAAAWRGVPATLRAEWQVVAVPRHPHASAGIEAETRAAGQPVGRAPGAGARASDPPLAPGSGAGARADAAARADAPWRWDDRTGVLNAYYAVADLAFVGGSLEPYGGHDPLEPAATGAAVIIGPHHPSQRDAVQALERCRAVRVAAKGRELLEALTTLLGDAAERERQSRAGLAVANESRGVARRVVARLAAWNLWP